MSSLTIKQVNKVYSGGVHAVKDANITVEDGEFIVLVGPSGCGKSTLLRMIAGLEAISSGEILIDDQVVNNKAPADRNISMVFQNYALYGHMTVYENMGLSLTLRKEKGDVIHKEVMEASQVVELDPYLNRKPANLSGGQRQRVALGRSIVRHAGIFLMDEPLSNLDAKLRSQTRKELVELHQRLATTFVYVTHDQIEAMTMADRIVILNGGIIQQIGTPKDVYDTPENLFVASFIGSPTMNFIEGTISGTTLLVAVDADETVELPIHGSHQKKLESYQGKKVIMGLRSEHVMKDEKRILEKGLSTVKVEIDIVEFLGSDQILYFNLDDAQVTAIIRSTDPIKAGSTQVLGLDLEYSHFFDIETQVRIREDQ